MGKYMVFGGSITYAHGGWHDFLGYVESLEEAERLVAEKKIDPTEHQWWHMIEVATGDMVVEKNTAYW